MISIDAYVPHGKTSVYQSSDSRRLTPKLKNGLSISRRLGSFDSKTDIQTTKILNPTRIRTRVGVN